jgi:DNA-binding NarL/FixJ family response regulator
MRILVIDDHLQVEIALRGILAEGGHTVTGARDPRALPRLLSGEEPFDEAIVDLRYAQSTATGLTALAILRERSPGTKTVIGTTDEEDNRLLYLMAAFQFFSPGALLAKRFDARLTRAIVEAVGRGEPAPGGAAAPFQKAASLTPPLLDRVVHSRTELGIWQELARFDKRPEIAQAAHVHVRTLDAFTAAKCSAIDEVLARFPGMSASQLPPAATESAATHSANLIRVIHFARSHAQFFADAEVAGLLETRWHGMAHTRP